MKSTEKSKVCQHMEGDNKTFSKNRDPVSHDPIGEPQGLQWPKSSATCSCMAPLSCQNVTICKPKASHTNVLMRALCGWMWSQYLYKMRAVIIAAETNSYTRLWAPDRGPAVSKRHLNLYLSQSSPSSCVWGLNWEGRRGFPCWHRRSFPVHTLFD